MILDKNNEVIAKLVAAACAPVKYERNLSVEEAVVQFLMTPSNEPQGHVKTDFYKNLGSLLFSESEVDMALSDLEQANIIRVYTPEYETMFKTRIYYQPSLDFVSLVSEKQGKTARQALADKKHDLIKVSIQIKGMDVTLAELHGFYKNVLWLFETQKHLEYIYVGVIKLSKKEALDLYETLKQQKAFE
ncbi:hypothetical protein AVU38_gp123 [Ralstonia phage RSL2]|uniref:Uncharacterized protein n=1 Tax=Ralstonia phage RSL2 TaxID=1585840 RepID=A0A0A8JBA1_9CAUD|nr:hypothetical protein AVU38_gp123 [Ralstonia phage RSL2]BAQ02651.1 hypothetical protein [Ralstonia phage RSL2]